MLNFLFATAYAQEAAAPAQAQNPLMGLLPFVLIFVIFYFLMIKPQKKKINQEQKMLDELKSGDEVYTKGGILGTITGVTDTVINLELADNIKIKVLKNSIGGLSKPLFEKKETVTKKK